MDNEIYNNIIANYYKNGKTDIEIDFWDERQTTIAAHSYLNTTNTIYISHIKYIYILN